MSLKKIYCTLLIVGGVFYSANIMAQQADSVFADINFIRKTNAWSVSENAAGLRYFSLQKISNAQLYANKSDGGFKNYYQSDNSYQYGLNAESIYRLNNKVVFSGAVDYSNFKGRKMGGSSFIDPYKNPFDIVETDEADKGNKQLETYRLQGAVSAQITSKLALGGKIDYQAANFAKMKDIRHVNKLLDLNLSLGATYQLSNAVEIGANYIYDRRIESVIFRSFGNKVKVFTSLINFGTFYGRSETFSNYGYTADASLRPLTNFTQGAALQLNFKLNEKTRWFNEFVYGTSKGFFGQEGTSSTKYTDHSVDEYGYKGVFSVVGDKNHHYISIIANYQNLKNLENVFRSGTATGGNTVIVYYGKNEVLDKQQIEAKLDYTMYAEVQNNNPKWVFNLSTNYLRRQQTTTIYPFYRDQTINSYQANANVKRNITKASQMYSVALGLGYGTGSGLAKYDGLYTAPSDSQTAPTSMDLYLYQEFEYFTKPRVSADLDLQYTKKLKENISPFVKLNYSFTKAFDTQFLGSSFGVAGLSVGCIF